MASLDELENKLVELYKEQAATSLYNVVKMEALEKKIRTVKTNFLGLAKSEDERRKLEEKIGDLIVNVYLGLYD